jgi:kynurenine formamidase
MVASPSEDEVVGYLARLSNAGRWGAGDELGTLNLITPDVRLRALATVRDGVTIGCARPIVIEPGAADVLEPPLHEVVATTPMTDVAPRVGTGSDRLGLPAHGVTVTHIDALSHFHVNGRGYDGLAVAASTAAGAPAPGSVAAMRDGILTRGVLVDVAAARSVPWLDAGEAIEVDDIERWEAAHDVRIESGDALLLRTGWALRRQMLGPYPERKHRPGLAAAVLPWLHERGVALVASDAAHDAVPSGYARIPMPIHTIGLVAMGLCLLDNADFEALTAACAARDRWTCLFIVAPLHWVNATGSPVTPLAVL